MKIRRRWMRRKKNGRKICGNLFRFVYIFHPLFSSGAAAATVAAALKKIYCQCPWGQALERELWGEFIVWQSYRNQNIELWSSAGTHGPKENEQQIVNSFLSNGKMERKKPKKLMECAYHAHTIHIAAAAAAAASAATDDAFKVRNSRNTQQHNAFTT